MNFSKIISNLSIPIIILLSIFTLFSIIHYTVPNSITSQSIPNSNISPDDVSEYTQFYPNVGQISDRDVFFYGIFYGGVVGFGESKIFLWSNNSESCLNIKFVNSNSVTPIGNQVYEHKINYFLGNRGTYTGVECYREIIYKNLWPGIDAKYNMTSEGLKYEFIVGPHADPKNILLLAEGHKELDINHFSVSFRLNHVEFIDDGLMAFQEDIAIDVKFISNGNNMIQFNIGNYDSSKALIIDPLIYSTYLGGNGDDYPEDIIVDSAGNIYVTGMAGSANFPVMNAYNDTYAGDGDCFVSKFDMNGDLVYSSFIGGTGDDRGESIALDSDGHIYITGSTYSSDFPTINGLNSTYGGDCDAFVLKLNSDGDTLLYSTFIGGQNSEHGRQIIIDVQGTMYIAGIALGPGLPMFNAFDATFNGTWDAFLMKLNRYGDEILYSTYIGGSDHDAVIAITFDSEGNLVLLGQTSSRDFPTINAYDDTYQGEGTDCFILKFNATGTGVLFSTYVGGSHYDYPRGMDLDSSDNIYVAGLTGSADFPVVNAFQSTYNGHGDCFVFKMNSTGTELEYSTYVGGWLDDEAFDIAVNETGDVFVGARTRSADFPTLNAFDRTHNGHYDFVVFQLDSSGTYLKYSTFIGGSDYEWFLELTADESGNVYLAVSTDSYDFPTINAFDSSHNGGSECVIMKMYPSPSDGDADRLQDLIFYSSIGAVIIIMVLVLYICRHKIKLFILTRILTDSTKKACIAGILFGLLALLLPFGFSYQPDWRASLSWTVREHSITFLLFTISSNIHGIEITPFSSQLGPYWLAYILLSIWFLICALKIKQGKASFRTITYTLLAFTIIELIIFFPIFGPEYGSIPLPLHLPLCLLVSRWGIPKESMDAFEDMEVIGKKEDAEEISPTEDI